MKTNDTQPEDQPLWTLPVSQGAANALRDHVKLIHPLICKRAQELAQERTNQQYKTVPINQRPAPAILRADVEQAIIEDLGSAITCQAARIRELASWKVEAMRTMQTGSVWREGVERMARPGDVANLVLQRDSLLKWQQQAIPLLRELAGRDPGACLSAHSPEAAALDLVKEIEEKNEV